MSHARTKWAGGPGLGPACRVRSREVEKLASWAQLLTMEEATTTPQVLIQGGLPHPSTHTTHFLLLLPSPL